MQIPLVSVIIPTWNRCALLAEAVASVRAQTFTGYELIVVDDGSDDGTAECFGGDPALQYIRLDRRSFPSAARNRGVAASRGRYVAFLDSDDLWVPEKLARQAAFFEANSSIAICHTDEQWVRNGKKVNQRQRHAKAGGDIFARSLELCLISPSAVIMTRALYDRYGGFDETLEVGEDYHLWLRITANETVGFIPEPLTVKRGGHADQLSAKYGQIEIFRIAALEKLLAGNRWSSAQTAQARQMLRHKCRVYAQGCAKRGRAEEADRYFKRADELGSGN